MRYHNITKGHVKWRRPSHSLMAGGLQPCLSGVPEPDDMGCEGRTAAFRMRRRRGGTFEALAPSWISGVTFSGGDPLHWQKNRKETGALVREIHKNSGKDHLAVYRISLGDIKDLPFLKYVCMFSSTARSLKREKDVTPALERQRANQRVIDVKRAWHREV